MICTMHQALCEIDALTGVATVVQCRGCHFVWHSRRAIQGVALVHIACNLFAHPSAMLQFPTRRERGVGCKAVQAVVLLAQTQARSTRSFVGAGMCLRATYPKHLTHTYIHTSIHTPTYHRCCAISISLFIRTYHLPKPLNRWSNCRINRYVSSWPIAEPVALVHLVAF
jgi:hypothetical protein